MFQGIWWVPEYENQKLSGILTFEDNRIRLRLIGQFFDRDIGEDLQRIEVIHGVTYGSKDSEKPHQEVAGRFIILQNCLQVNHNFSFGNSSLYDSLPTNTFSTLNAFVFPNSNFVKDTSLNFHKVKIQFSHLPDFAVVGANPITIKREFDSNEYLNSLKTEFKFQVFPSAKIKDINLEFEQGLKTSGDRKREFAIKPSISFKLSSNVPLSLDDWQSNFITPLQHFLTLATTEVNYVTKLEVFNDSNVESIEIEKGNTIFQEIPIDVINEETLEYGNKTFNQAVFQLFTLKDIVDRFSRVMPDWYKLYEKHRVVQNLLFGVLFSKRIYIEDRFLNLARALEVYHRTKYPRGIMPTEDFKKLRDSIISQVKTEQQKWLKEKLAWANELSLNERLQGLLKDLADLELSNTLNIDEEKIGKRIKDSRNQLTHYSSRSKSVSPSELTWLSYLMEYLLQALLLKEIGFSATRIKNGSNFDFRMEKIKNALSQPKTSQH
ncbi:MAG: hypothetical protein KC422_11880 [Trueperaceae bacterium]|nr:hypothetical protein [Trueperaceae bacterium]